MRVLGLAALAAVPLQWFVVGSTPVGVIRVHQLAALLFSACILAAYRFSKSRAVAHRFRWFIFANAILYVIWVTVALLKGRSAAEPAKQLVYLAVFLAFAAFFFAAATDPGRTVIRALRWASPVTATVFLAAFVFSAQRNGLNAWALLKTSIATGDPNVLQFQLFRTSFVGFGYDLETVRANFRHEIFGGVLFSMYVSSWAYARVPVARNAERLAYRGGMLVCTLLLLLSLSRAIQLAAAVWPCLYVVRTIVTGRVNSRHRLAAVGAIVALGVVVGSGLGLLLWNRFTAETGSYTVRQDGFGFVLAQISEHFWTGDGETAGPTSHNFVLDAWQNAGVFVAIPAIAVFSIIVLSWLSLLSRLRVLPPEVLPVVAAMALPVVRLVTAGGGRVAIVEWLTLAFVAAVVTALGMQPAGQTAAGVQPARSRPSRPARALTSAR
ncbi:MAG: hypothetical protein M3O55_10240 [Actinomycetota bacterium]|nr:hypothetical protein [Actinomycetota bacterium]